MGLAGSSHCVGMCGGVASAINYAIPKGHSPLPYHLMYNTGRLVSYSLSGALVASLGMGVANGLNLPAAILGILSGLFLILLAGYIGQWWNILVYLERVGRLLWRYLSPFSKRFIPFNSPFSALPYGMIWGWLPCGLVYSALTWSMASAQPLQGLLIMLGFGLGTLPAVILMGLGAQWLRQTLQHRLCRQILATFILLFAAFSLYQHTSALLIHH